MCTNHLNHSHEKTELKMVDTKETLMCLVPGLLLVFGVYAIIFGIIYTLQYLGYNI
jgi:hypothetical protein